MIVVQLSTGCDREVETILPSVVVMIVYSITWSVQSSHTFGQKSPGQVAVHEKSVYDQGAVLSASGLDRGRSPEGS